jgi:deoxycytidine triphosphate deaminase
VLNRSSLFRCGASTFNAFVDPGYKGALTFGLKNISDHDISIQKGVRVAQIVFEEVTGGTKPYSGRYQGGKVV